jgi:hypothetical protein
MDAGRRWALEIFGTYGPQIRDQIAEMVKVEHEASVDAQEASGHRSRSVYGEFWRGILEKFELFGALPGASLERPGEAPYKIPVVNGVALYPWRYAKSREIELAATPFGTSDARLAVSSLRPRPVQAALDLNVPDPGLSDDERDLLATFQSITEDPVVSSGRLVLVAISSSVNGLFSVEWGEVELNSAGFIEWVGPSESLLSLAPTKLVSSSPSGTFTAGEPPRKFPNATPSEKPDSSTNA